MLCYSNGTDNDVMTAILKVLHHMKSVTQLIDVYLLEGRTNLSNFIAIQYEMMKPFLKWSHQVEQEEQDD